MASNYSDRFPVSNPKASFWNSEARPLDNHRTTATLPSQTDIVIIGSGFAGVATAYHILKDHPNPPSIVILEARKLCSGATGRNGGHLKQDTYFNVTKYTNLYGAEAAAELAAFETANVYAVKSLVETESLDCDFHLTRAIDVFLDPQHAWDTETAYRRLFEAEVADLRDTAFINKQDAEIVTGVKGAQCGFSFTAGHVWPLKMIHQLLAKLIKRGVNVQANTPVLSVSQESDSAGQWTVNTARGVIRTSKVVYATNGYTSQVLPEYERSITPIRGICSHITTPHGTNPPHLSNTYGIKFDARNNDYLIARPDGSIIVGGARQRFWHNRDRWFGTVKDDELVDEAISYFDGYMQRHFHGWEESGARTEKVWTGIMGYSSDFMPHIGEVPGRPGQFIIAAFNGHGMPQILLSAKGVAAMVRDGVPFEKTGIPRIFKTTRDRIGRKDSPLEDSLGPLWDHEAKAKL